MIDPIRQELLQRLDEISELAPALRLGQLTANLAFLAKGPWDQTLWDLEDREMLEAANQLLHDLKLRENAETPVEVG